MARTGFTEEKPAPVLNAQDVEDLYALTPMQQQMLAQSLTHPRSYFECGACTLDGDIDGSLFLMAWSSVIKRHTALRTSFHWNGLSRAVQAVHRHAEVPLEILDLRSAPNRSDRVIRDMQSASGPALTDPPLLRLSLLRMEDSKWRFVWRMHHLIHDAWSTGLIIREFLVAYEASRKQAPSGLPAVAGFGAYVRWLRDRDGEPDAAFWSRWLAGWKGPTPIPFRNRVLSESPGEIRGGRAARVLPLAEADAAAEWLNEHHFTWSTLIHAAWALFLSEESGDREVSFGTVATGRPDELPDATGIVGPFIRAVPVKARVDRTRTLRDLLRDLQAGIQEANCHCQIAGGRLLSMAGRTYPEMLFTSLVVLQSIVPDAIEGFSPALKISEIESQGFSGIPFTLRATPGRTLKLEALFDSRWADQYESERTLERLAEHVCSITQKGSGAERPLGSLMMNTRRREAPKFFASSPRPLRVKSEDLVTFQPLFNGGSLPMLAMPGGSGVDLPTWVAANRERVEEILLTHGGILFRGFAIAEVPAFEAVVKAVNPNLLEYVERSTPRTLLAGRVYTSTEYPADQWIALHNEFSYSLTWPMKIGFYCVTPPPEGGATPIVDCRRVLQALGPVRRAKFEASGIRYSRNFGLGIDLSWEEAFQTTERDAVERHCREAGISFEWTSNRGLRTHQQRPAIATHPKTGDRVWFNQAHLFHVSNLKEDVQRSMLALFPEKHLPRNAYLGDGSPLEDADLAAIRAAYHDACVRFSWQRGDLLLLDNMLIAHGREPYSGLRQIAVAMTEPYSSTRGAQAAATI